MSKKQDRTVYRRNDGKWVNKRNDASKASSIHDTQKDANDSARNMLKNQGGGELTGSVKNFMKRRKKIMSGNQAIPTTRKSAPKPSGFFVDPEGLGTLFRLSA